MLSQAKPPTVLDSAQERAATVCARGRPDLTARVTDATANAATEDAFVRPAPNVPRQQ
ncbi:hypothetical protein ACFQ61_00220 [Streptomyces sp. NPDC056500]|uniref:hypothetical protein n=1 Tax=Streptomyces sp. NPDC056500 TaxID=3345840 RepID=UPI003677A823